MEVKFSHALPIVPVKMTITELSDKELYFIIFSDCSIQTLGRLNCVSKFFNSTISNNDLVWKIYCEGNNLKKLNTWKNLAHSITTLHLYRFGTYWGDRFGTYWGELRPNLIPI